MLNSWGITDYRPKALLAVNMHMDYNCTVLRDGEEGYTFYFQTLNISFGSGEEAPEPPMIQGNVSGQVGADYIYTISAVDNQGDDVYFSIDWDDDIIEEWIGPVASGEEIEVNHTWNKRGDYVIKVKAKDEFGEESFTTLLEISMPKNKFIKTFNPWILRMIQRFPIFEFLI